MHEIGKHIIENLGKEVYFFNYTGGMEHMSLTKLGFELINCIELETYANKEGKQPYKDVKSYGNYFKDGRVLSSLMAMSKESLNQYHEERKRL